MASPTLKPNKKLAEFLNDQQEPFILQLYLLERSKIWNSNSNKNFEKSFNSSLNIKTRKPLFPFFKACISAIVHKKKLETIKDSNNSFDQTGRFSTASSSTIFNSCSEDIDDDEDRTLFSSYKHQNSLFSSDNYKTSSVYCNRGIQSQQDSNNRKHHQRCIQVCVSHETLNKDVCVCGISKESLLSAALLREILVHKRVLNKTKRLLFDCVREISKNVAEKDCKQFMGPEMLGNIIWDKTKKWSQLGGGNYGTNLRNLLNFDYLDTIDEWSEFKREVKDVSVEIADAILECVIEVEIVLLCDKI